MPRWFQETKNRDNFHSTLLCCSSAARGLITDFGVCQAFETVRASGKTITQWWQARP